MKHAGNVGHERILFAFSRVSHRARELRVQLAEVNELAELLHFKTGEALKTEQDLETEIATAKKTVVDALAAKDSAIAAQKATIDQLNTLNQQLKDEVAANGSIDSDKLFASIQDIADTATAATAPAPVTGTDATGTTGS